jgi:hypothetical protein
MCTMRASLQCLLLVTIAGGLWVGCNALAGIEEGVLAQGDDGGSDASVDVATPGDGGNPRDSAIGADGGCATGLTPCGASCVDLTSDPAHCGSCAHACPSVDGGTPTCSSGGTCGFACATGYHACTAGSSTVCVSNSDPNNCGTACDTPCPGPTSGTGTASCDGTKCTLSCAGISIACGTVCLDAQSDPNNCGACGHKCATAPVSPGTCSGGMCSAVNLGATNVVRDMVSDGKDVFWTDDYGFQVLQAPIQTQGSEFVLAGPTFQYPGGIDAIPYNGSTLVVFTRHNQSAFQSELWAATPGSAAAMVQVISTTQDFVLGVGFNPVASQPTAYVLGVDSSSPTNIQLFDLLCFTSPCNATSDWTVTTSGTSYAGVSGYFVKWAQGAGVYSPFWTLSSTATSSGGTLYGGNEVAIQTSQTHADSLTSDGSNLYWVDYTSSSTSAIMSMPIPNPASPPFAAPTTVVNTGGILTLDDQGRAGLASDGKYVYFTGATGGSVGIYYAPVGGGAVAELTPAGQPWRILAANASGFGPVILFGDVKTGQAGIYEVAPGP